MRYQAALRPDPSWPARQAPAAGDAPSKPGGIAWQGGHGRDRRPATHGVPGLPPEPPRPSFCGKFPAQMTLSPTLAAASAPSSSASFFIQTIPLVLVFVMFWILMIRPQQKRMQVHQATIAAVKKGDRVVTGGGLIGRVVRVTDDEVEIELGPNVRVTALKSTLSDVVDPTAKPAND